MLIIKPSLLFLVTLAYVGAHVKACPYLEGESVVADHARLTDVAGHVTAPRPRGVQRHLQAKGKFLDRIRKFFRRGSPVPPPPPPPMGSGKPPPPPPPPMRAPPNPAPATAATPLTGPVAGLSVAQLIANARAEILAAIAAAPANTAMAAKMVRLSFHDCVGGCDGCVDMSNLDNRGLDTPINVLQPIVTKYTGNTPLTRADIWVLAGLTAAGNAQSITSEAFPLTLIGRPVCANFPNGTAATRAGPDRTMPSAHLTSQQLVNFFSAGFGFTADETVAIMGAHTL
jgi:Peroxidase